METLEAVLKPCLHFFPQMVYPRPVALGEERNQASYTVLCKNGNPDLHVRKTEKQGLKAHRQGWYPQGFQARNPILGAVAQWLRRWHDFHPFELV